MKWIAALAAVAGLQAGQAGATVVNINAFAGSFSPFGTPTTVNLAAGNYLITYVGTGGLYTAWDNSVNGTAPAVSGCGAGGANCGRGFADSFAYSIGNTAGSGPGATYVGPANTAGTYDALYSTAAGALTAYSSALPITTLSLASASNVTFYVPDYGPSFDNSGGVSLNVTAAAVPEPASLALLAAGLASIAMARRSRRA